MVLLLGLLLFFFVLAPPWAVAVLVVTVVLEIGEIAALRVWSRRLGSRLKKTTGAEAMIGARAKVVSSCRPEGTVRLKGELWQARCDGGADAGAAVRVQSVDGLTLVVSANGRRP